MIPVAGASGLILIDKPRGITSFGVVSRLRRLTGIRRIGHTGTLDPFADGLLVVCLGRATAVVQFMEGYDKAYRLGIAFGRSTDTQDLTGQTTFTHELTEDEAENLRAGDFASLRRAVGALPGDRIQMPPMYSAVKVDGRPLYVYARKGQDIERKGRPIRIYAAGIDQITLEGHLKANLTIRCSKGTYIRTLADDLGRELGYGAHAERLTRLQCGPFSLSQALSLEQLQTWRDQSADSAAFLDFLRAGGYLLPIDAAFAEFPRLRLPESTAERLINGQRVDIDPAELGDCCPDVLPGRCAAARMAIFSRDRLIAVAHLTEETPECFRLITERVLVDLADFRQS